MFSVAPAAPSIEEEEESEEEDDEDEEGIDSPSESRLPAPPFPPPLFPPAHDPREYDLPDRNRGRRTLRLTTPLVVPT